MIHRISAASGRPISAPTTVPLARSTTNSLGVMRLKPKRCSSTKVLYSSKRQFQQRADQREGRQQRQLVGHVAPGRLQGVAQQVPFSRSSPPSSVQPSSTACRRPWLSRPKRPLAMV
jgi:hypothetical protein